MEESLNMSDNRFDVTPDLASFLRERYEKKEVDIRTYSPLTLAYIGDSIFDVIVRTLIVERGNLVTAKLHKEASGIVNAKVQARLIESIEDILTKEEEDIYHRGRNAKSHTSAKNASVIDYRKATGLEALLGYLYLLGEWNRMLELIDCGFERLDIKL